MVRLPRRLSRPIPAALGLSMLLLAVIYGGMEIGPRVQTYRRMQELDRMRQDASLSPGARAQAAQMLAEYGTESLAYMLVAARDAEARVREKAYAYLASTEPITDEAVELCLSGLGGDREPRARAMAATGLGATAFLARSGRPDRRRRILASLAVAGRDASPIVRHAAVRAMVDAQAMEFDPSPWLEDPDRSVRLAAAEAICWLDPTHRTRVVPALRAMVLEARPEHPIEVIRPMALLFRVDRSACRGLVPTFVSWLHHEDPEVRGRVALWLSHFGPMAREAAPALGAMLETGPPARRAGAAMAVICVDPTGCDRAVAMLLAMLRDPNADPRQRALALPSFAVMFRSTDVPAPLRIAARDDIRSILDQPGIHPMLGQRIRMLIEPRQDPRRQRGPAARLISAH